MKSGAQLHDERHGDAGAGTLGVTTGVDVAKEVGLEVLEQKGRHTAGGVGAVLGIGYLAYEYLHGLAEAEKKGEEIRAAFDNDAVNVSLARTLALHPAFGELEAAKRASVGEASSKLSQTLNESRTRP